MYRHGVSLGTFLFGVLKGVLREWLGALTYCVSDITVSNTISRSDPASIQDTSLLQDDLEELLTVVLGLAWHKDSALAAGAAPLPVPFSRPPYTHFCLDTLQISSISYVIWCLQTAALWSLAFVCWCSTCFRRRVRDNSGASAIL
jgi:hypothetical protein